MLTSLKISASKVWNLTLLFIFAFYTIYAYLHKSFEMGFRSTCLLGLTVGYYLLVPKQLKKNFMLFVLAEVFIIGVFICSYYNNKIEDLKISAIVLWPLLLIIAIAIGFTLNRFIQNRTLKQAICTYLFLFLVIPASRKFGEGWFAVVTIISFFDAAIRFRESSPPRKSFLYWSIFCVLFLIPFIFFSEHPGLLLVMPLIIIAMILSYFLIFSFSKAQNYFTLIFLVLSLSIVVWAAQENWATYIYSRDNVIPQKTPNMILKDRNGKMFLQENKCYYIYLFWSAHCGSCKKEFPYFEKLANKLQDRKHIKFVTVFLKYREADSVTFNNYSKDKNSSLMWLISDNSKIIIDSLVPKGVPHLTITDPGNKILYNGFVRNRPWIFINRAESFVR
jgi:thiol-disulfide isomerase/thioredoxin